MRDIKMCCQGFKAILGVGPERNFAPKIVQSHPNGIGAIKERY
jgi:hypothetical protein